MRRYSVPLVFLLGLGSTAAGSVYAFELSRMSDTRSSIANKPTSWLSLVTSKRFNRCWLIIAAACLTASFGLTVIAGLTQTS
ncbi:hypothetical protein ALON55S_04242 [Alishewanella longhuensis]